MNLEQLFQAQKKQSWQLRKQTPKLALKERREILKTLLRRIIAQEKEICAALKADFNKSEFETLMTEIYPVTQEIRYALANLESWMQPKPVESPTILIGTTNEIYKEPKGVVLIIAPWNYPFQLAMIPFLSALAAGNCVMMKPSELTPHISAWLEKTINDLFPANHAVVVLGDKEVSTNLLKLPFDHIFFTGSTPVGKIVMEAASKNLTSVTLELGGKSPTIVDDTANLNTAIDKILWGKFVNAGQTCVAPDYLLVQSSVHKAFVKKLKEKMDEWSKTTAQDHAAIISASHLARLKNLLDRAIAGGAVLVSGGQVDDTKKSIESTVLEKVSGDSEIMCEEIFGPLLPIVNFAQINDAVQFVNQRPKPLALYLFSNSEDNIAKVLRETSAGGVCINETLIHLANHHLPFGGVGESGMGHYHGQYSFDTFSHQKAVLRQSWMGRFMKVLYPPYAGWKLSLVRKIIRWGL
ncbi:MAG: aldehyde dehydrogenase family protein [Bdellovibrionaceae bacterium]|nr:aldehyde dehydrogenase family protein [Pseudobdellovibrionaceae bacterium]